jgi:hypothetical protein
MKCPNELCNNRALLVQAETETTVHFTAEGKIGEVEHGEWYIRDESEAECEACHWVGIYANCKEPDDLRETTGKET